ncbi:hypothetical protein EDD16DRAFT_1635560 [Pisolithus croceorrhizus]|nr:hypothetical protein EDD16DRAFT_1635560 [Pisolithus croceorrhizus]KAI6167743.1 hypothetical protein EDD17DRAFT_860616 [Pisolithus thermaeus]
MSPIPQSSISSGLSPFSDGDTQTTQAFYQNPYFIAAIVALIVLLLLITCRLCALRRSRRPLSNFFVRRRRPGAWPWGQQPAGTPYGPYGTSPIGMQHRPVANDQNGRPLSSSYAPGGYRKEPLPMYDNVGAPPRYGDPGQTTNGSPVVQPSSMNPAAPPPAYQGPPRNS